MYEHDSLIAIFEDAFESKDEVHDYLADILGLPEHYGRNLDALRDCLSEMDEPVLISVVRSRSEGPLASWFDKLCLCLMICARENTAVDMEVVFEDAGGDERHYLLDEEAGLD